MENGSILLAGTGQALPTGVGAMPRTVAGKTKGFFMPLEVSIPRVSLQDGSRCFPISVIALF
jgi:hypothetical protein